MPGAGFDGLHDLSLFFIAFLQREARYLLDFVCIRRLQCISGVPVIASDLSVEPSTVPCTAVIWIVLVLSILSILSRLQFYALAVLVGALP